MIEPNRDKAGEIEKDIVQTQNSISDTVEKLKERLTPQSLLNSILGDEKQGFDQILSLAKRNPFAVALIGAGAVWLATGKEAKLPTFGKSPALGKNDDGPANGDFHRSYVDHMAQIEMRENEPLQQYQQRRDLARSNYFMIERTIEEDDTSFRTRLDEAGEKLRDRTSAFGSQLKGKGQDLKARLSPDTEKARRQARAATEKAKQLYRDNAVVGGLVAVVAGAIAGSTLPTTRLEQDKLGDIGDTAREAMSGQKDMLFDKAEKALGAVEDKIDRPAQ